MADVRLPAARALLAIDNGDKTLAAAVDAARDALDDPRDRALLVELTAGTLRWRNEVDAVIAAAARRAAATLDPPVRAVLRLGAYQLRHLDRIPAHAVVHESVDVVRKLGAQRAAGLVNAVLRGILRRDRAISLPKRPGADASTDVALQYLSITLSHPAWLVRRWLARYGFDATERWCLFNNAAPSMTIRPLGDTAAAALAEELAACGIAAEPAPFVDDALRLAPGALGRVPAALADRIQIQDEGAQLVARYAGATPGERVLDLCASPGGKSLVIAGDLALATPAGRARSVLVSCDRRPARVALLARTMARAGLSIPIVMLDALKPLPFPAVFDAVVVDAPCSGLGTLRRDPDLKWSRTEGDLARLADDEFRMLCQAAECVRPGGRLVYATCSSEPDENRDVVGRFLAAQPAFTLAPPAGGRIPAGMLDAEGCLTTTPAEHGLDAFFAATLVRRVGA